MIDTDKGLLGMKGRQFALAVDIGGTKMSAAVVDSNGCVDGEIDTVAVPFDPSGQADSVQIGKWIFEKKAGTTRNLIGVGLSVCGNVDEETGFVPLSANLHWRRVPLGEQVKQLLNLPIMAATDVRMAGLAEAAWGAARGIKYFAWATIGTGFGGYLFLDGKPYRGFHGYAGNFGHNTWDELNGVLCGCGKPGCIETFVSGPGIARAGQKAFDAGELHLDRESTRETKVTTYDVFTSASNGDQASIEILDECARLTAIHLAGLVNILDLEMIIIGGGVANASNQYFEQIQRKIPLHLMTEEAKRDLKVVPESFSNAALIGAASDVFLRSGILEL
jgi:glucokinase